MLKPTRLLQTSAVYKLSLWATTGALVAATSACSPSSTGLGPGEERLSDREAENTASMIDAIQNISLNRADSGTIKRFNQSKSLGCFDGTFTVRDDLAEDLSEGIFVPGASYPAQVRFASATQEDDREKDFRGGAVGLPWSDKEEGIIHHYFVASHKFSSSRRTSSRFSHQAKLLVW